MLEKLRKVLHMQSRRHKSQDAGKNAELPSQSTPTWNDDRDSYEQDGFQPIQWNPVTAQDNAWGQLREPSNTNGHNDTRQQGLAGEAQDGHPTIRPLEPDLQPRSPAQHLKSHDLPRRDSSSSMYSDGSSLGPTQSVHGAKDVRQPKAPQGPQGQMTNGEGRARHVDSMPGHGYDGANADVDYSLKTRDPVTHENVTPHVHTIYQPRRTRSIHFEEHRYLIQPVVEEKSPYSAEQPAMSNGRGTAMGTESLLHRQHSNI